MEQVPTAPKDAAAPPLTEAEAEPTETTAPVAEADAAEAAPHPAGAVEPTAEAPASSEADEVPAETTEVPTVTVNGQQVDKPQDEVTPASLGLPDDYPTGILAIGRGNDAPMLSATTVQASAAAPALQAVVESVGIGIMLTTVVGTAAE